MQKFYTDGFLGWIRRDLLAARCDTGSPCWDGVVAFEGGYSLVKT
jgi:hypothetical protein